MHICGTRLRWVKSVSVVKLLGKLKQNLIEISQLLAIPRMQSIMALINLFVYSFNHLFIYFFIFVYVTGVMWSGNHLHQYCCDTVPLEINSLAPGKFEWNFRYAIFNWILVIDGWGISCEITLIWMSLDFTDDQSTLVQVMAWCRQATSHYLSQCWPRSLLPYGVTRPQWVNLISTHLKTGYHQ